MSETKPHAFTHAAPPSPKFWVVNVLRTHLEDFRIEGVFSHVVDADKMADELLMDSTVEHALCNGQMTMAAILDTMLEGTPLRGSALVPGPPHNPTDPAKPPPQPAAN